MIKKFLREAGVQNGAVLKIKIKKNKKAKTKREERRKKLFFKKSMDITTLFSYASSYVPMCMKNFISSNFKK